MSDPFDTFGVDERECRVDVLHNEVMCHVTILHVPTGIKAESGKTKSQLMNKREAYRLLAEKLANLSEN